MRGWGLGPGMLCVLVRMLTLFCLAFVLYVYVNLLFSASDTYTVGDVGGGVRLWVCGCVCVCVGVCVCVCVGGCACVRACVW